MTTIGLVGARGYVGRELIRVIDADERFDLAFAASRMMAGKKLGDNPGLAGMRRFSTLEAMAPDPERMLEIKVDVVVLGLPNGLAQPYVDAFEQQNNPPLIIDLSSDHRRKDGWVYGVPEVSSEDIKTARRIANPGCYATAANLSLWPLRDLIKGPAAVFGVSGFSGAGTTPSQRNDPERVEANIIPYGFGGHLHQREIASFVGVDIVFAPHVANFFRGMVVTTSVQLQKPSTVEEIGKLFAETYSDASSVIVSDAPPEVALTAGTDLCAIGGFALSVDGQTLTMSASLDNLRKGAATQAVENIVIALGL